MPAQVPSALLGLLALLGLRRAVGATPSPVPGSTFWTALKVEGSPTASPADVDWSALTIFNDGAPHVIDGASPFLHENVVVTDGTTLTIETGGSIKAPENGYKSDTDWAAVRLSMGSVLNATGGSIVGSRATSADTDGGEAIEVFNGQSSPDTASYAYFYDGVTVAGGDASDGVGGNALHVHGFGTEAYINGGTFKGGKGSNGDDGLAIHVLNSGKVHVHSGSFEGEMVVGDGSTISFYGCFMRNDTIITGVFVDDTYLEAKVRTRDGGEVLLISVAEQECDTAPSIAPTNFPTMSSPPTVLRPNSGRQKNPTIAVMGLFASLFSMLLLH